MNVNLREGADEANEVCSTFPDAMERPIPVNDCMTFLNDCIQFNCDNLPAEVQTFTVDIYTDFTSLFQKIIDSHDSMKFIFLEAASKKSNNVFSVACRLLCAAYVLQVPMCIYMNVESMVVREGGYFSLRQFLRESFRLHGIKTITGSQINTYFQHFADSL